MLMKDDAFTERLAIEFDVCPAWSDVERIETLKTMEDLKPHEIMMVMRPKNLEFGVADAFRISIAWQTFSPRTETNQRYPSPCSSEVNEAEGLRQIRR